VGSWTDGRREPLRRRYEQVVLTLGRLLGRQRRYGEAAETFARLVEHDPFLEAAHRGLMRCHMALGNRARAIRQYHELVELLSADIGTAPAPETTALYTKLRAPTPALAGAVSPVRK
jgi:DNA-binding SARP family transcriptional activator